LFLGRDHAAELAPSTTAGYGFAKYNRRVWSPSTTAGYGFQVQPPGMASVFHCGMCVDQRATHHPCAADPRRGRRPKSTLASALVLTVGVLAFAGSIDGDGRAGKGDAPWFHGVGLAERPSHGAGEAGAQLRLRLRGGRVKTLADKLYAKKNKETDEDKAYQQLLREEEEEIAEEYRGLPYEERLKLGLGDVGGEDRQDVAEEGDGAEGAGARAQGVTARRTIARAAKRAAEDADASGGEVETLANVEVLRTGRTSGDAWPGLFFDLQAKEARVKILGISTASHFFRKAQILKVFSTVTLYRHPH